MAPHLVVGSGPRDQQSRADLEREAQDEIQARIDRGRPGPEEGRNGQPLPDWAVPTPRPSRPVEVVAVRLDALRPAAPIVAATPVVPAPAKSTEPAR
jgi:hypothetical protein